MKERKFDLDKRASGILLHPTSLPGGHGCGDLGPGAYQFADFLEASGQRWWQMLPVVPPTFDCPYHALSAFAGNPLFISLEILEKEKDSSEKDHVDYATARRKKGPFLRKAFLTFQKGLSSKEAELFEEFCKKNRFWLEEYALFSALKESRHGAPWTAWESALRSRDREAVGRAKKSLKEEIDYHRFVQYQFLSQWLKLKEYCNKRHIGLIGDIPIFVAHDSSDVWAHQTFFDLDQRGRPKVVAGVPPDYFSRTGQRWGNPLYRWDKMREEGYAWWIERLRAAFVLFDVVRLDHFIGFHRYWEIPSEEPTALHGRWREGPGADFFEKVFAALGPLPLIAEDLGWVTPEVKELRDRFHLPGLRVLQFAFGSDSKNEHLPEHYPKRCIVYTGTHDNNTTVGWFNNEATGEEREKVLRYLGTDGSEIHWEMIRLAMESAAAVAIFPLQDILGLGNKARMNLPGTVNGNWKWRFRKGVLTKELSDRLQRLTVKAKR